MKALTILITGATAGIGRTTALHLARAGHSVIATGRRESALESLREEARGTGLLTLVLDVTKPESIAAARARVDEITDGQGLDVLVNNAGYGLIGPAEMLADADVRAQFDTNVFGLLAMVRAFVPAMRARGAGRIVNVSSVGGRVTFPFMGAYNATKYAVESLSDAMRIELSAFGIKVVLIEPGVIQTEFADVAMATKGETAGPYAAILANADRVQRRFESTGVGPEHVARAIERAITARRPSARYVVPLRTFLVIVLFRLLPTSWTDAAFRMLAGISARALRQPVPVS